MIEIHWNKKWKRPREDQKVLLMVNRCVMKVGYDWDMEAAQREILQEMGVLTGSPWEVVMDHPSMGDFRKKVDDLLGCLVDPIGHTAALRVIERLKRSAVREFVARRLHSKMCAGARREIHFSPVDLNHGHPWEGPWRVIGKRRAMTGVYVPASSGWEDYDYEPPDLMKRKTHVLLLATREMACERVVLLASDTCDWVQKEVADTLMK